MIVSYSRKGNPYDNACIESFHSTLKKEYIHHKKFDTIEEIKIWLVSEKSEMAQFFYLKFCVYL